MPFNLNQFDRYFEQVIQDPISNFCYMLFKAAFTPSDTGGGMPTYSMVGAGVGNWAEPLERTPYQREGRIMTTEAMLYLLKAPPMRRTETYVVYRWDTGEFFDVLGFRNYDSHKEVDSCLLEAADIQVPFSYSLCECDIGTVA